MRFSSGALEYERHEYGATAFFQLPPRGLKNESAGVLKFLPPWTLQRPHSPPAKAGS
jgi:hypothetical protein